MYLFRRARKQYRAYPKPASCQFCNPEVMRSHLVQETVHAYVVPNRTPYSIWENRRVIEHLMVIPKEHVASLLELSNPVKVDVMNLIGEYEQTDYNVYARAVTSGTRSVEHQHTHLIKTEHRTGRFLLLLQRPYLLIRF